MGSGIISFGCCFSGCTDYSHLKQDYAEIEVYKDRLSDVKRATYKSYKPSSVIVEGSIENMNQSTNLSHYIEKLAEKEAAYYGYLACCKATKQMRLGWLFGDGAFISNKIYDLPDRN